MGTTDGVVRVEPLTAARWDDAVVVFGARGDPASCWCQFFRLGGQEWRASTAESNREALRTQCVDAEADDGPAPGLLAYIGDEPVGWVALAPRASYPRLGRSPALAAVLRDHASGSPATDRADSSTWSVTCFVVRVGFRRRGLATSLLDAAVAYAARRGAQVVEGYPVDVTAGTRRPSSELYHGTRSTFAAAGFVEVGRSSPARPVMRRVLA
jgi:ribosomal protein S18 acetylase RimI-like enzyme